MKLSKALLYITAVVLFAEASFDFFWKHKSTISGILIICIASLVTYAVASANRKANQKQ